MPKLDSVTLTATVGMLANGNSLTLQHRPVYVV